VATLKSQSFPGCPPGPLGPGRCGLAVEVDRVLPTALFTGTVGSQSEDVGQVVKGTARSRTV